MVLRHTNSILVLLPKSVFQFLYNYNFSKLVSYPLVRFNACLKKRANGHLSGVKITIKKER